MGPQYFTVPLAVQLAGDGHWLLPHDVRQT
jgi:hypothetical protein